MGAKGIWLLGGSVAAQSSVALACLAHRRARGSAIPKATRTSVVVLGYPALRRGQAHPVQRWRARLAASTASALGAETVVFTGGGSAGGTTEAAVMADLATSYGLAGRDIQLETASTNTWENVANTIPLVEDAACVVLVSDPLHATRARLYWLKQRPGDDGRVFVTDQSGFWDHWWLKLPTALDAAKQGLIRRIPFKRRL